MAFVFESRLETLWEDRSMRVSRCRSEDSRQEDDRPRGVRNWERAERVASAELGLDTRRGENMFGCLNFCKDRARNDITSGILLTVALTPCPAFLGRGDREPQPVPRLDRVVCSPLAQVLASPPGRMLNAEVK